MITLEALEPGTFFETPYFGKGKLLRVGPTFAVVLPLRPAQETSFVDSAGKEHHFTSNAPPVTIAPGTEVTVLPDAHEITQEERRTRTQAPLPAGDISLEDLAAALGRSAAVIRYHIKRGNIVPDGSVSGRPYFSPETAQRIIAQRRKETA